MTEENKMVTVTETVLQTQVQSNSETLYLNTLKCLKPNEKERKIMPKLYFCKCSILNKKIICDECIIKCHFHCGRKYNLLHIYNYPMACECRNDKHEVKEPDPEIQKQKINGCITNIILKDSEIKTFLRYTSYWKDVETERKGLKLCSICSTQCYSEEELKSYNKEIKGKDDNKDHECTCEKHTFIDTAEESSKGEDKYNHIEFIYRNYEFLRFFPTFGINMILNKFPFYLEKLQTGLNSKDFFAAEGIDEFIELYFECFNKYSYKFYFPTKYLKRDDSLDTLMEILKIKTQKEEESSSAAEKNQSIDYILLVKKFIMANATVDYYIRKPFTQNCNYSKVFTIVNMNPIQRKNYLKNYNQYFIIDKNIKCYQKERSEAEVNLIFKTYLDIFESIIENFQKKTSSDLANFIAKIVLPMLTKTCYQIVKYHLVSDEWIETYFKLLKRAITIFYEQNFVLFIIDDNFSPSIYNVIKSILVYFFYMNDTNYLEKLQDLTLWDLLKKPFIPDNTTYSFLSEKSDNLNFIFLNLINLVKKSSDVDPNTKVFRQISNLNVYIQLILEMMIGDHCTYYRSLCNLTLLPENSFSDELKSKKNEYQFIFDACSLLQIENIKFIEDGQFDNINKNVEKIVEDMCNEILKRLNINHETEMDPEKKVEVKNKFTEIIKHLQKEKSLKNNKVLFEIQNMIRYSNFLGFFSCYMSHSSHCKGNPEKISIKNDFSHKKAKILLVLYLIILKNNENLCLFLNIDPYSFLDYFKEGMSSLFFFFKKIIKNTIHTSNNYRFSNFNFFLVIIILIVKMIDSDFEKFKKRKNKRERLMRNQSSMNFDHMENANAQTEEEEITEINFYSLNKCIKLLIFICRNIQIKNMKRLEIINLILITLRKLDIKYSDFKKYTMEQKNLNYSKFFKNYFKFLSELVSNGIAFLGIIDNEPLFKEFELDKIKEVINSPDIYYKLKIEFIRYCFLSNLNKMINIKNSLNIFDSAVSRKYIEEDCQVIEFFSANIKPIDTAVPQTRVTQKRATIVTKKSQAEVRFDKEKELAFNKIYKILKEVFKSKENIKRLLDDIDTLKNSREQYLHKHYFFEHCILRPSYQFLNTKYKFNETDDYAKNYKIFMNLYYTSLEFKKRLVNKEEIDLEKHDITEFTIEITEELQREIDKFSNERFLENVKGDKIREYLLKIYKVDLKKRELVLKQKESEERVKTIESFREKQEENYKNISYFQRAKEYINEYLFPKKDPFEEKEELGNVFFQNAMFLDLEESYFSKEMIGKVDEINLSYKKSFEMKIGEKISLIRILNSEGTIDFAKEVFFYSISALSKSQGESNKIEFGEFNIYCSNSLVILNRLFYHYSKQFQELLEMSGFRSKFIAFIIQKLIFPIFIYHLSKLEELESKLNENNIGTEILKYSIQILKNCCEDHNYKNQKLLFGLEFDSFEKSDSAGVKPKADEEAKKKEQPQNNKEKEEPEKETSHLNFINFMFKSLRLLLGKIADKSTSDNKFSFVFTIMNGFDDLMVEMVQGTDPKNLESIFSYPKTEFSCFSDLCTTTNFHFLHYINTIRKLINAEISEYRISNKDRDEWNEISSDFRSKIFYSHFNFLKNLAMSLDPNQGLKAECVKLIMLAYPPKILLVLVQKYLLEICEAFGIDIEKYDPLKCSAEKKKKKNDQKSSIFNLKKIINFITWAKNFLSSNNKKGKGKARPKKKKKTAESHVDTETELLEKEFQPFIEQYKDNKDYEDNQLFSEHHFFKIGGEILLFLTIINDKFDIPEIRNILGAASAKTVEETKKIDKNEKLSKVKEKTKEMVMGHPKTQSVKELLLAKTLSGKPLEEVPSEFDLNGYHEKFEITKFYKLLIRNVEFVTQRYDGEKELKKLYFLSNRNYYLLNAHDQEAFFENVDRKTATSKLKATIEFIKERCIEIKYKEKKIKTEFAKSIFDLNHSVIDFFNTIFSFANMGVMVFSANGKEHSIFFDFFVTLFVYVQITFNLFFLISLVMYKYNLIVKINMHKMGFTKSKEVSLQEKFSLYFLKSFLYNEKFSFLLLNVIICKAVLDSPNATFLFAIQLVSILKNSQSTLEMVMVFKDKIPQIISLGVLLLILLYFYTNLAFYNYTAHFIPTISESVTKQCTNLFTCTYQMIKSGMITTGGALGSSNTADNSDDFLRRYFIDTAFFIIIVLILMNSLNGMIITSFAQIREDRKTKEDDIGKKCFICSTEQIEFDKLQISFENHKQNEHNFDDYLRFLVLYQLSNPKDIGAEPSFIVENIGLGKISCFPINKSLALGYKKGESEAQEEESEDEDEKKKKKGKDKKKGKKDKKGKASKKAKAKAKQKQKQKAKAKQKQKAKQKAKAKQHKKAAAKKTASRRTVRRMK